ncbi:DUF3552 domain-containing protein, partial [bacterium]|nr:DUF3552 domain-containing protein [bacterium]
MDNSILIPVAVGAGSAIVFFVIGFVTGRLQIKAKLAAARQDGDRIVADAQKEAETMFKEKMLELRDEQLRLRTSLENEIREKKDEIARQERSLKDRDAHLKTSKEEVDKRRKEAEKLINANQQKQKAIDEKQELLTRQVRESQEQLERIANLSKDQAVAQLKEALLDQARDDCAEMIKEMRDEARRQVNKEAKEIVVAAIQRSAADHSV